MIAANGSSEALLDRSAELSLQLGLVLGVAHFVVDALLERLVLSLALGPASGLVAHGLSASLGSVDLLIRSVHLNLII